MEPGKYVQESQKTIGLVALAMSRGKGRLLIRYADLFGGHSVNAM